MVDPTQSEPPDDSDDHPLRVSILVVSFNTRQETLDCLASVYHMTRGLNFELLVVDNASQDGSADAIARDFPHVDLIRTEENLGFGAANNLAARAAKGELLLLLNPDTILRRDAVSALVAFSEQRPQAGIWGGRTELSGLSAALHHCRSRLEMLWSSPLALG
jgi:GT2 family glycosyltransferase